MNNAHRAGRLALGFALSILLVGQASASIVTFEGHSPLPDGAASTTHDGFGFDFWASGWAIALNDDGLTGGPYVGNGTVRSLALGDRGGSVAHIDMTPLSGPPFSLNSIDAATAHASRGNGSMTIIGQVSGGGTVTHTISLTTSFAAYLLPSSFTNLTSVRFEDIGSGSFTSDQGIAIDNIRINEASSVPEPATLAMFGVGALGLVGAALRRRRPA